MPVREDAAERLRRLCSAANAGAYLPPPDPTGSNGVRTMATKVSKAQAKGFEFKHASGKGGGFAKKYPWDEWFSGDLYIIERHDGPENAKGTIEVPTVTRDYGVPVDAMFPKTKTAARRRYKMVQISKRDDAGQLLPNGGIYLKARDMTEDERAAEDLLRAEEKARGEESDADTGPVAAAV